jgi:hypothetical protein
VHAIRGRQSFENRLHKLRRQVPSWGGGVQSAHIKRLWISRRPSPSGPSLRRCARIATTLATVHPAHGVASVEVVSVVGVLRSMSVMAMLRQLRVSDCFFLMDRSGDPQPSHLGQQRGSLQSEFRRCATWSTNGPGGLLQRFHNQSAIGVFQGHR